MLYIKNLKMLLLDYKNKEKRRVSARYNLFNYLPKQNY